jgi:predicted GH43/DUF377 family glycosyl hydrolase
VASFVDRFGPNPRANQALWERCPANPVIPVGAEWCREFISPSSLLMYGDAVTLYAEGGAEDRECFGRYRMGAVGDFATSWIPDPGNPLLEPSPSGFDSGSVFDPAAIRFRSQTLVFYSATTGGAHAFAENAATAAQATPDDETIGRAIESGSGVERGRRPVISGRCPNVIEHGGELFLLYVKVIAGGYRIFGARSADGAGFVPISNAPVLDVGSPGAWDCYSVTTPKVFADGGRFAMLYAGDAHRLDDPTGIGLAVSDDLITWRKHPGNPVFVPGRPGEFDSLSVSSAVPFRVSNTWHILYAGGARAVSEGLQSQIGTSRLPD